MKHRKKIENLLIFSLLLLVIGCVIVFSLNVWADCRESGNSIIFCIALIGS
jgi:hypothetical protein